MEWANNDDNFKTAISDARGKMLDECISTARVVALGIADRDSNGNFIGWKERPDPSMLRYFMSTLGRKEGFGENIDVTTNGETINKARNLTKEEIAEVFNGLEKKY